MQQNQIKELKEIKVMEPDILPEEELKKRGIEKVAEDEVFKHIYTSQASQMCYYATNYGRIATQAAVNRQIRFLKLGSNKGYMMVTLSGYQNQYINRLVADAFVKNEYNDGTIEDKEAHHINRNRSDNRAVNLIWLKDADHDLLHKKIDMISLYSDGQCSMAWHRLAENRMDLEELVKLIDYTEVPLPLFFEKLREQKEYKFDYTGKYSGDRRSMRVKVIGKGADMPEISVYGKDVDYTVVVRLKEEFVLEIGKTPLTEAQKEAHREDKRSGEFDRRIQESLELQKQTELLFDMVK